MVKSHKNPKPHETEAVVPAPHAANLTKSDLGPGSIYTFAFVSGLFLMGFEILASRVLAPEFGYTVYVWGSLLSVFLAGLCAGYFLGGKLANRFTPVTVVLVASFISGIGVAAVASYGPNICRWILEIIDGEAARPLVASAVLFLLPTVAYGVIAAPLVLMSSITGKGGTAGAAGTVYALSTLGNIVGCLATTFIFIPNYGTHQTLWAIVALQVFLPTAFAIYWRQIGRLAPRIPLLFLALLFVLVPATPLTFNVDVGMGNVILEETDTLYHEFTVEDMSQIRTLKFGRFTESAIETKFPYRSVAPYPDYFYVGLMHPFPRYPMRVALLGAGGGIFSRALSRDYPSCVFDVVDIDKEVLRVCHEHFHLEKREEINMIAADAREFMRTTDHRYDIVILDAFSVGGRIPFHLVTRESFERYRDAMRPTASFMVNLNSSLTGPNSEIFQYVYSTLTDVFPNVTVYFVRLSHGRTPDTTSNIILVGDSGPGTTEAVRNAAWPLYRTMPRRRLEYFLADRVPDPAQYVDFSKKLTDDYSPIDTLPF